MSNSAQPVSKRALKFIFLLGFVSLFADITYEGARSLTGPYLFILGASGTAVGLIAGLGELIAYGLRLISGVLADRTGRYWAFTLTGYALNLLAVPLLALAGRWEMAAVLIIAERLGKAVRSPAKDAMLSYAASNTGSGKGFGLHEALDQIGAMTGPLILAGVLAWKNSYQLSFAILAIPAILALGILLTARFLFPEPASMEKKNPDSQPEKFDRPFWFYMVAIGLLAAALLDFPLMAFHLKRTAVVPETWIPILYAGAMGVDGLAALVLGRWFDRVGIKSLIAAVIVSLPFALFVFSSNLSLVLLGLALWAVGLGAHESILKATVATMIPPEKRGTAFGVFNTVYGLSWFAGSAVMGTLYDISISGLVAFSVGIHAFALIWLLFFVRKS